MDHVAIMRKSWGLTEKILDGRKKIESRWYLNRSKPWDAIKKGDTVYFKNSGEPVSVKATVARVLQFSGLTPKKVAEILRKYGKADGIEQEFNSPRGVELPGLDYFYERFKNKRYCLLIFLESPRATEPFDVDKRGFGMMAAWLTVPDVKTLRRRT